MDQKRCKRCGAIYDDKADNCDTCDITLQMFDSATVIPKKLPNILVAYVSFFKNWNKLKARSTRFEYWVTFVANLLAVAVIAVISGLIASVFTDNPYVVAGYAVLGYLLLILVPLLSLTIRRFHDLSLPGGLFLFGIIPIFGWLFVISSMTRPSSNHDNKFGENPYLGREVPNSTYKGFFGDIVDAIFLYHC